MPLVGGGVVPLALKDVPAELSVSTIPPAGRSVRNKPEVAATVGQRDTIRLVRGKTCRLPLPLFS